MSHGARRGKPSTEYAIAAARWLQICPSDQFPTVLWPASSRSTSGITWSSVAKVRVRRPAMGRSPRSCSSRTRMSRPRSAAVSPPEQRDLFLATQSASGGVGPVDLFALEPLDRPAPHIVGEGDSELGVSDDDPGVGEPEHVVPVVHGLGRG